MSASEGPAESQPDVTPPPGSGSDPNGSGGGSWPPDAAELLKEISDYLILERIGVDGCGAVFKAREKKLNRLASIRVLPPAVSGHPDFGGRIANEMGIVGQIRHPHLAEIQDFGVTAIGRHYLAAEFVEGYDLNAVIQSGTVTTQHVAGWMPQLLAVLETLHGSNAIHGWLNPGIVRVEPSGNLKVTGFGLGNLSDLFGGAAAMNASFQSYVAPECIQAQSRADHRADLYAAGVLLYQMLTGTIPQGVFQPPSQIVPGIDMRYDTVVTRALQADPVARYQSVVEFRDALAGARPGTGMVRAPVLKTRASPAMGTSVAPVVAGKGSAASRRNEPKKPPISPPAQGGPNLGLISAIGALVVVLGVAGFFGWKRYDKARTKKAEIAAAEKKRAEFEARKKKGSGLDMGRVTEVGVILLELRQLAPFDPELAGFLGSSELLMFLLANAEMIDSMVVGGDSPHSEMLSSWEFLTMLQELRKKAHLPAPVRRSQSGSLLAWLADGKSEPQSAAEVLPGFSGPDEDLVEMVGDFEAGLALTSSGVLSTWGTSVEVPELGDIASIDCEGEHFAALLEEGRVSLWGSVPEAEAKAVASWKNISKIAVGAEHLLAINRDFKLLTAGSNLAGQTGIPKNATVLDIVAIAAEGDRSAALSAGGSLYFWGDGKRPLEKLIPALYAIEFRHGKLIGVTQDGRIIGGLEEGKFEPLELGGGGDGVRVVPRMSPDGNRFAFFRDGSRWLFAAAGDESGDGFDVAFCEEQARGSVDVILGTNRVLAIAPSRMISSASRAAGAAVPRLTMTTIDDVSVPEELAYRDWSPVEGEKKRARLLAIEDETHARMRFSNGAETAMPLERFDGEGRAFAAEWMGKRAIDEAWLKSEFSGLALEEFLSASGYTSVDFQLAEVGPLIEGTANSKPVRLVVDTGASTTLLQESFAEKLGMRLEKAGMVTTWQGLLPAKKGKVKTLRFGDVVLNDVEVTTVDFGSGGGGQEIDGLLGIDVLQSGDVAYDFGEMNLLFRKGGPAPESERASERSDSDESAYRDWTSKAGTTIRAKLSGNSRGAISLQKPDGTGIEVPAGSLSDADREYLDLHELRAEHRRKLIDFRRRLKLGDYLKLDPDAWEVIDYQIQSDQQIIEIQIEGRAMQFFIDTGAKVSKISEEAARNLGRRIESLQESGRSGGLEGTMIAIRADDFKTVQIGARTFFDFRMHVYDFGHMSRYRLAGTAHDGVIGADLLERLGAILDHDTKRIILPVEK